MNKRTTHTDITGEPGAAGQSTILFGKRQVRSRLAYATTGLLVFFLFVLVGYLHSSVQTTAQATYSEDHTSPEVSFSPEGGQAAKLVDSLKQYGLWHVQSAMKIPRFFIKSYPADLNRVYDISLRKRIFLNSLLPHALYVQQETLQSRTRLESILNKIDCAADTLDFGRGNQYENRCSWKEFLPQEDINFVKDLCRDYRTTSATTLLKRVDVIPVSIILAQGALESSWGSSRFTREGNSIFGMWTWNSKGIVPSRRDDGKTHKVKSYESVLESVRSYHLTLNRLDSYEELRNLRLYTDNPLILAEGLKLYSARGSEYVEDIRNVILSNDLQRYDSCSLNSSDLPEFNRPVSGIINLVDPDRISL